MKIAIIVIILIFTITAKGQYPFEKFPAISLSTHKDWKISDKGNNSDRKLLLSKFYKNGDSLTIQIIANSWDSSSIWIYRNSELIQSYFETCSLIADTLYVGDINGDSLLDVKLIAPQNFNGIGGVTNRVLYLFQKEDGHFVKISYFDMFEYTDHFLYRAERDFDNDKNYEIITMTLRKFEKHNYWTFNLYNYLNGGLVCVNSKFDYPIMIEFLDKVHYNITEKISKGQMRLFSDNLPVGYDRK